MLEAYDLRPELLIYDLLLGPLDRGDFEIYVSGERFVISKYANAESGLYFLFSTHATHVIATIRITPDPAIVTLQQIRWFLEGLPHYRFIKKVIFNPYSPHSPTWSPHGFTIWNCESKTCQGMFHQLDERDKKEYAQELSHPIAFSPPTRALPSGSVNYQSARNHFAELVAQLHQP